MNTSVLIVLGLFIHWLADFVYQTHWQATNKTVNNDALLGHTITYSAVITGAMLIYYSFMSYTTIGIFTLALLFGAITLAAHTATDYVTSRMVKKCFDKKDYHNGFAVVGFDQILHYVQLYFTFKALT